MHMSKVADVSLDTTDWKILRAIQEHPNLAIVGIAEKVGLSEAPCWRRLKRMESDGVLRRQLFVLNQNAVGLNINVFAHLRLRQHDELTLESLERAVRDQCEIIECFSMTGGSDYLLRVVVGSIEDYGHFLKKVLLHLPGVAAVNSSIALKTIKMTMNLPI